MNEDRNIPYRCQIPEDVSRAVIGVRGHKLTCQILDVSREDFHVRLPARYIRKVKNAKKIEVFYQGEHWVVQPRDTQCAGDELFLLRVDELTPLEKPSPWTALSRLKLSQQTDPRFVLTVVLAFVLACLALPGLGDRMGTAPKVKKSIRSVVNAFK